MSSSASVATTPSRRRRQRHPEGRLRRDTYLFSRGDGQDVIYDSSGSGDRLVFGAGIVAADIAVSKPADAYDVILSIKGTTDRVTLDEQDADGIEQISFADGTSWTYANLKQAYFAQAATSGNDVVVGFRSDDSLAAAPATTP